MTTFYVKCYDRDPQTDDVVGADVIVSADNGQTIDSITLVNDTRFKELENQLNSLGSDYVKFASGSVLAGSTIDTILENLSETAEINATKLGGQSSTYYAKANHTHSKTSITNLYAYDISLSKYNAVVGDTINVTASVYNMDGSPVQGERIPIYLNGKKWADAITNINGVYTKPFKTTTDGLITFGLNNEKVQCLVTGIDGTEWTQLEYTSNFQTHSTENFPLKYRVQNGMVNITGRVSSKSNIQDSSLLSVVAYIPEKYAPSYKVSAVMMHRGRFTSLLQVFPDGRIGISRYGNAGDYDPIPKDSLIRIDITYLL